jgi:hypothetical protein
MSSPQPAFSKLNSISPGRSPGRRPGRRQGRRPGRRPGRKTRRRPKISPTRKRPLSPLSNERDIKEFEADTSPKTTPIRPQSLKNLAIEMANSKEKQPGCFGKFCKKVASKFTRRRGGEKKRRRTRKRRKGRRVRARQPPRRR